MGFDAKTLICTCDICHARYLLRKVGSGVFFVKRLSCVECGEALIDCTDGEQFTIDRRIDAPVQ